MCPFAIKVITNRGDDMPLEIFHISIQPIIDFFHLHPHWAGIITFFVVFCEAMAVIGVIVPGSITMTAIGVLMGSGVISIASNYIWAICGAILGDYISYVLGLYFKGRLHRMWPFSRYPQMLAHGEKFFADHGGKSVIIGRFFGPMRSMIPMVAGMLKMSTGRFLLAAIPSASLWAVAYITPGVLLGALALELPPKVATKFLLWAMLFIIVLWGLVWLAQHFVKHITRLCDRYIEFLWHKLRRKHSMRWLLDLLADPSDPSHHQQLTLLICSLLTLIIFGLIIISVMQNGTLTAYNQPLYHLLHSLRTPTGDRIMLVFTFLGETKALFLAQVCFIAWLAWRRYWYVCLHAVLILGFCYGGTVIKNFTHVARPNGLWLEMKDYSFPSGHLLASVTIYGFMASVIAREMKNYRWIPYTIVSCMVFVVALSRLYLGAHWLTDVLGGIFLGLSAVMLVTISYRRRPVGQVSPGQTALAAGIIVFSVLTVNALHSFRHQLKDFYSPYAPMQRVDLKTWRDQTPRILTDNIPVYRTDRLGHPVNAFNIQWVGGDLSNIENFLISRGWQSYQAHFNLQEIVRRLTLKSTTDQRLPILTQLYNNRPEALLLTKNLGPGKPILILRLWDANVILNNSPKHLWVGVIDYYQPPEKLINIKKHNHMPITFVGAVQELAPYVKSLHWRKMTLPSENQPEAMRNLQWNGDVLLVESPE